jgi:hypothetical protein
MPESVLFLVCVICDNPVGLETARTDESGNAVHEDCYVRSVSAKPGPLVCRSLSTAFRCSTLTNN